MKTSSPAALVACLLRCIHYVAAQPIIYEGYHTGVFTEPVMWDNKFCYSPALGPLPGIANTPQLLAMFSDKFVESNGRVFTVQNANQDGGYPRGYDYGPGFTNNHIYGLYEVSQEYPLEHGHACLDYENIFYAENIGQIVAARPDFFPIVIIGVDQVDGKVYGYYQDSNQNWRRKATTSGRALDGSLATNPVEEGKYFSIVGITRDDDHPDSDGRLFSLSGDFENFRLSQRPGIKCAGRPATIGDWTGPLAKFRGNYCPREGDNQVTKRTWHGSGTTIDTFGWEPAAKIARTGPKSNIYGISTNGKLIRLWYSKSSNNGKIYTAPMMHDNPDLTDLRAVGGLADRYGAGFFVSNGQDKVFNPHYWYTWTVLEIDTQYDEPAWKNMFDNAEVSLFFGHRNGKSFLLKGFVESGTCNWIRNAEFRLFQLNYLGGNERYQVEDLSPGEDLLSFSC